MDSKVEAINRELKRLDEKYFCRRSERGTVYIAKREAFALRSPYSLCFALTDDFTLKGKPIDFGIVPIIQKIRFGDDPDKAFAEMDRLAEEEENSKRKAAASSAHEIADRMHWDARRAWSDINTSCMDKKKEPRNGNRKSK